MRTPSHLRRALLAAAPALVLALGHAGPASATMLDNLIGRANQIAGNTGDREGAAAIALQRDGRIVHGGIATVDGIERIAIGRLDEDGRPDPGFNGGRTWTLPVGSQAFVNGVALQPDGRIVGGGIGVIKGNHQFVVVRVNRDGTPDTSFGTRGMTGVPIGAASMIVGTKVDAQGRIVAAGSAIVSGKLVFAAIRLLPDGKPDPAFGDRGIVTVPFGSRSGANGLTLRPGGGFVMAGEATLDGVKRMAAVAIGDDGRPDPSFGNAGLASIAIGDGATAAAIERQPDGRIVVTGTGYPKQPVLAAWRLEPDGRTDTGFGDGGVSLIPVDKSAGGNGMALQSDGKILIIGVCSLPRHPYLTVRLNADGSRDASFGDAGVSLVDVGRPAAANGIAVQRDGQSIVLVGAKVIDDAGNTRFDAARLDRGGRLQPFKLLDDLFAILDPRHPAVRAGASSLRPSRTGRLRVRVTNRNPFAVTGTLYLTVRGVRGRTGRVRVRVPAHAHRTVTLRLPARMRSHLGRRRSAPARLVLSVRGPAGRSVLVRRASQLSPAR